MPNVFVASMNPVEVNAVRAGFYRFLRDDRWEVKGCTSLPLCWH